MDLCGRRHGLASVLNLFALPPCRACCRYGNVYGYMPASVARDISIVLMVAHQVIVFGLVRAAHPAGHC